jgi:hypothetical protein
MGEGTLASMGTTDTSGLESWADRAAVVELLHRYAIALDSRDWAAFRRLFTDDVVVEFMGGNGKNLVSWSDLETMATYFESSRAGKAGGGQHVISNEVVELDGDRARAIAYGTNRVAVPRDVDNDEEGHDELSGSIYEDDFVRTREGWRISRHTIRGLWRQETGASTMGDDPIWKVAERGELRFFGAS